MRERTRAMSCYPKNINRYPLGGFTCRHDRKFIFHLFSYHPHRTHTDLNNNRFLMPCELLHLWTHCICENFAIVGDNSGKNWKVCANQLSDSFFAIAILGIAGNVENGDAKLCSLSGKRYRANFSISTLVISKHFPGIIFLSFIYFFRDCEREHLPRWQHSFV